jgi:SAM-dependent methyltransferase
MEQGYPVDAVDGSEELCKAATEYTGIEVKQMLFRDLNVADKYDGIWACSSILHLPKAELLDVISKMIRALKSNGVIYTSFKYGEFEGERNERYFTDFTERSFREYITEISNIAVEESWISRDVRPDRDEEKWLNLILRRRD